MENNKGILYVVATPIGNLDDITLRALKVLSAVDFIVAENTHKALKLLNHYKIKKSVFSMYTINFAKVVAWIEEGKTIALISEAGTPGVSDPGQSLVRFIREKEKTYEVEPHKIIPIPGASALIAAASVAGMPMDQFVFLGFPPLKKRKKFFEKCASYDTPVILYESPYRLMKTLNELKDACGDRAAVVCKELTKIYEKIYCGTISEIIERVMEDGAKGEYVIIIDKSKFKYQNAK